MLEGMRGHPSRRAPCIPRSAPGIRTATFLRGRIGTALPRAGKPKASARGSGTTRTPRTSRRRGLQEKKARVPRAFGKHLGVIGDEPLQLAWRSFIAALHAAVIELGPAIPHPRMCFLFSLRLSNSIGKNCPQVRNATQETEQTFCRGKAEPKGVLAGLDPGKKLRSASWVCADSFESYARDIIGAKKRCPPLGLRRKGGWLGAAARQAGRM